jgi:hypothetical protein
VGAGAGRRVGHFVRRQIFQLMDAECLSGFCFGACNTR